MLPLLLPVVATLLLGGSGPTTFEPAWHKYQQTPDSIYLRGRIVKSTGKPVPNTRLRLRRLHLETVSDNEGEFAFAILLKRAVRNTKDKLLVMDGLYQAQFLEVKLFAAGPVILTVFTLDGISVVECTTEDIMGNKRTMELRKATGSYRRNTPNSTYTHPHLKQPFQRQP